MTIILFHRQCNARANVYNLKYLIGMHAFALYIMWLYVYERHNTWVFVPLFVALMLTCLLWSNDVTQVYNNNNFILCYLSKYKDNIFFSPTITTTATFNSACTFMTTRRNKGPTIYLLHLYFDTHVLYLLLLKNNIWKINFVCKKRCWEKEIYEVKNCKTRASYIPFSQCTNLIVLVSFLA